LPSIHIPKAISPTIPQGIIINYAINKTVNTSHIYKVTPEISRQLVQQNMEPDGEKQTDNTRE
jgi:hypothetical protein